MTKTLKIQLALAKMADQAILNLWDLYRGIQRRSGFGDNHINLMVTTLDSELRVRGVHREY